MDPIIQVQNVKKNFKSTQALDGISITIQKGEIYGLLGPNGSGKTTLIRMLVGLVKPTSGTVMVMNQYMPSMNILGHIGYMTQQPALYSDLTVLENLQFFASIYNARNNISETLELVNLTKQSHIVVANLSGGMKQRCSLACAIVHQPKLLFLDEPTVGVDPELRRQFWNHFRELATNGSTIIVSSHIMDEAEHCDRLGLVRFGKLIAEGKVQALKDETHTTTLEDAFLALSARQDNYDT